MEKDSGPPEGPRRPLGVWEFGVFSFATPESRKGSHVPGQRDQGLQDPSPVGLGGPGPFPSRPWRAPKSSRTTEDLGAL